MLSTSTQNENPSTYHRYSIWKWLSAPIVALVTIAVPLSADQLVLGAYSHATVEDEEATIDFEIGGFNFLYANFNGDLYWSVGAGVAKGEDELCAEDFCIDFEIQTRITEFSLGVNLNNLFTPFVTLGRSDSDIDWGITGLGLADTSDSETSIDVGSWIGGADRRFQIAVLGVDSDDRAASIGGYTVLDSGLTVAGFFSKSIEGPGDAMGISIGLGWSF